MAPIVTARVTPELEAAIDRRFQAASKANKEIREAQYRDFEHRLKARDPGSVAMWNAISIAIACLLTWLLVKNLDDTARDKERAGMQARLDAARESGYQLGVQTGVAYGRAHPAPSPAPATEAHATR
jgi:hypothetical protein